MHAHTHTHTYLKYIYNSQQAHLSPLSLVTPDPAALPSSPAQPNTAAPSTGCPQTICLCFSFAFL